jgi:hypothetical protein
LRGPVRGAALPVDTPCFRHRGYVGKTRGGLLNALECYGPQSADNLADRLGFARVRDMRRRHLTPLLELGLIQQDRDTYAIVGHYTERVEDILNSRYGGGSRRVKRRDGERVVTVIKDVPPKSEVERSNDDARKYQEDREKRREIMLKGAIEADQAPTEEEMDLQRAQREASAASRVEQPLSELAQAIKAYLEDNPHDADQPAGWLGTTCWTYDRIQFRPTPQDSRAAVEELGGHGYLRSILARRIA